MERKFKVDDIIHKKRRIKFNYRLKVIEIKNGFYVAEIPSTISRRVLEIKFDDEDKYELVPRNLQYSQHLKFNRNGIIHK